MTPGIMLTGVGKRYDIVSCFAALTTVVAVDPNPLAPLSTRRSYGPARRQSQTQAMCPSWRACAPSTGSALCCR